MLRIALTFCGRFARKRAQQGNVHIGKMEYFKALAEFEQALEASPNVPDILLGYSQVIYFFNARVAY